MKGMKLVEWTDGRGYKHLSYVKQGDPDEYAKQGMGIPHDPPDLSGLNWPRIRQALHNALVDRRVSTWKEVQQSKGGLTSAILGVLRRELQILYREREVNQK